VLETRATGRGGPSWTADPDEWHRRYPDLEISRTPLPGASAGDVLSAACPSPLLVISTGHGTLLHRSSLDGPHRWLLRHCTSPMALVPLVHRPDRETRKEILAAR
jgi:hypothetical protein